MNSILSIPDGFNLFGVPIKIYGITSALAYLLGILMTCVFAKKRGFKKDDILTLALYVVPMAIIGARLYYVIFQHSNITSFADVFNLRKGGLAFYGGMIGGALAVLLYCLIHKKNFLALIDIIAPSMILAQALGRWGNFFNQEAYGNYISNPSLQWFPFGVYIDNCQMSDCTCPGFGWHYATFFYESMWNLLVFVVLTLDLYLSKKQFNGCIACGYLVLYGLGRMIIEGMRTDSLYLGAIRVSQLLSLLFILLGTILYVFLYLRNRKKKDSFDKIMEILKKDL